ncbi:hypothetical protein T484DRAFT_1794473 [Baffinella frigidus]|nr:hypothetical protein T484DRAFT_1794473 [Cryptophyta sp. CCMP2293]
MVSNVALSTSVVLLAAAVVLGQDLAVPNGEGGGLATSGGGGGGRARTAPTRVQQVTLYPATEPGGRMEVNPPFLEMIEKEPGERPVDSDLKAVNRMLLGEDMAAFQFATVEQLGAVHENEEAMTRIFRAPLVRYIEGPKGGVVQLVALGMGDQASARP